MVAARIFPRNGKQCNPFPRQGLGQKIPEHGNNMRHVAHLSVVILPLATLYTFKEELLQIMAYQVMLPFFEFLAWLGEVPGHY